MGVVLCDCDKRISRDQPNDFPTDKKIESPITPLSNISTSFISKKTSFRTINSTSSIEEHMLIDKTVIIGKGEGDINDTYEIGKKIGGGTYGIVFLSLNKRTKEKVAIKAMKKLKKDDESKKMNNEHNPDLSLVYQIEKEETNTEKIIKLHLYQKKLHLEQ